MLRFGVPKTLVPVNFDQVPRIQDIDEIITIPKTTLECGLHLPTDATVVNLVVQEPLPLEQLQPFPDNRHVYRSLEVVDFLLSNQIVLSSRPYFAVPGCMGKDKSPIRCKVVTQDELSVFNNLKALSPEDHHHIVSLALEPLKLPSGRFLIIMPDTGDDLEDIDGADIPRNTVPQIVLQLCDAIGFLHSHGFYHLDINPANITLSPDGQTLTVIDLGTMVHGQAFCNRAVGTRGWVSPQVQAWHHYDYERSREPVSQSLLPPPPWSSQEADIWAVGSVVMYLLEKERLHLEDRVERALRKFAARLMTEDEEQRSSLEQARALLITSLGLPEERNFATPATLSSPLRELSINRPQLIQFPLQSKI